MTSTSSPTANAPLGVTMELKWSSKRITQTYAPSHAQGVHNAYWAFLDMDTQDWWLEVDTSMGASRLGPFDWLDTAKRKAQQIEDAPNAGQGVIGGAAIRR